MTEALKRIIDETQHSLTPKISTLIQTIGKDDISLMLCEAVTAKKAYDRALMVRLACEAVGGKWTDAICAMTAVELMDFSVIVIDDILDESPRRKNELSVQNKWGIKNAIIAASVLKSFATQALLSNGSITTVNKLKDVVITFEQIHHEIYVGQFLDIKYEGLDFRRVDVKSYLEMIQYTTGSQISGCCKIGGIIGGGRDEDISSLGRYGLYTGTIFQIRDDLIDYIDSESDTWKTPFLDFKRKKKRLPLLLGMRNSSKGERVFLQSLFNKRTLNQKEKEKLLQIITKKKNVNVIKKNISTLKNKAWTSVRARNFNPLIKSILRDLLELGCNV